MVINRGTQNGYDRYCVEQCLTIEKKENYLLELLLFLKIRAV